MIEKWEIQKKIEERFLQKLEAFEWNDKAQIKKNFPKLWVSKEKCLFHIKKRLEEGDVVSEDEYIEKTFETLAEHTSVIIYEAPKEKSKEFWHRIFYSKKCEWIVILGESGSILTAYLVKKGEFEKSLNKLKIAGYKSFKGAQSERIRKICKKIYLLVKGK